MSNRATLIVLFFFILCASCKSQEHIAEKKLKGCIEQKFDNQTYKLDSSLPLDYYQIMSQMENHFIAKGIGKNTSKEGYLKIIDEILNSDEANQKSLYSELILIAKKNNYNGIYFSTDVMQNCPQYITSKEKEIPPSMAKQFNAMDKLFAFDPYDQNYMSELVNTVDENDFKKLTYRVPIITILFEYLGYIVQGK